MWANCAAESFTGDGGPGSGNYNHAGRPGYVGGSLPKASALNSSVTEAFSSGDSTKVKSSVRKALSDAAVGTTITLGSGKKHVTLVKDGRSSYSYTKNGKTYKVNTTYIVNSVDTSDVKTAPVFHNSMDEEAKEKADKKKAAKKASKEETAEEKEEVKESGEKGETEQQKEAAAKNSAAGKSLEEAFAALEGMQDYVSGEEFSKELQESTQKVLAEAKEKKAASESAAAETSKSETGTSESTQAGQRSEESAMTAGEVTGMLEYGMQNGWNKEDFQKVLEDNIPAGGEIVVCSSQTGEVKGIYTKQENGIYVSDSGSHIPAAALASLFNQNSPYYLAANFEMSDGLAESGSTPAEKVQAANQKLNELQEAYDKGGTYKDLKDGVSSILEEASEGTKVNIPSWAGTDTLVKQEDGTFENEYGEKLSLKKATSLAVLSGTSLSYKETPAGRKAEQTNSTETKSTAASASGVNSMLEHGIENGLPAEEIQSVLGKAPVGSIFAMTSKASKTPVAEYVKQEDGSYTNAESGAVVKETAIVNGLLTGKYATHVTFPGTEEAELKQKLKEAGSMQKEMESMDDEDYSNAYLDLTDKLTDIMDSLPTGTIVSCNVNSPLLKEIYQKTENGNFEMMDVDGYVYSDDVSIASVVDTFSQYADYSVDKFPESSETEPDAESSASGSGLNKTAALKLSDIQQNYKSYPHPVETAETALSELSSGDQIVLELLSGATETFQKGEDGQYHYLAKDSGGTYSLSADSFAQSIVFGNLKSVSVKNASTVESEKASAVLEVKDTKNQKLQNLQKAYKNGTITYSECLDVIQNTLNEVPAGTKVGIPDPEEYVTLEKQPDGTFKESNGHEWTTDVIADSMISFEAKFLGEIKQNQSVQSSAKAVKQLATEEELNDTLSNLKKAQKAGTSSGDMDFYDILDQTPDGSTIQLTAKTSYTKTAIGTYVNDKTGKQIDDDGMTALLKKYASPSVKSSVQQVVSDSGTAYKLSSLKNLTSAGEITDTTISKAESILNEAAAGTKLTLSIPEGVQNALASDMGGQYKASTFGTMEIEKQADGSYSVIWPKNGAGTSVDANYAARMVLQSDTNLSSGQKSTTSGSTEVSYVSPSAGGAKVSHASAIAVTGASTHNANTDDGTMDTQTEYLQMKAQALNAAAASGVGGLNHALSQASEGMTIEITDSSGNKSTWKVTLATVGQPGSSSSEFTNIDTGKRAGVLELLSLADEKTVEFSAPESSNAKGTTVSMSIFQHVKPSYVTTSDGVVLERVNAATYRSTLTGEEFSIIDLIDSGATVSSAKESADYEVEAAAMGYGTLEESGKHESAYDLPVTNVRSLDKSEELQQRRSIRIAQLTGWGADMCGTARDALLNFSRGYDSRIRKAQREGDTSSFVGQLGERLEDFIAAAPKWSGGKLMRGIHASQSTYDKLMHCYETGELFDQAGTSSWSDREETARSFATSGSGKYNIVLVNKSGRTNGTSIKAFSYYSSENEVLVSKNAKQRITKIEEKTVYGTKYLYAYCEEV